MRNFIKGSINISRATFGLQLVAQRGYIYMREKVIERLFQDVMNSNDYPLSRALELNQNILLLSYFLPHMILSELLSSLNLPHQKH